MNFIPLLYSLYKWLLVTSLISGLLICQCLKVRISGHTLDIFVSFLRFEIAYIKYVHHWLPHIVAWQCQHFLPQALLYYHEIYITNFFLLKSVFSPKMLLLLLWQLMDRRKTCVAQIYVKFVWSIISGN